MTFNASWQASQPPLTKNQCWCALGRWVRRHRRGILRSAAILCVAALGGLAFYSSRRARILSEREVARDQFTQFTRLADQAQFFAATNDAAMEKAPYYDLSRAIAMGTAALAIAIPWQDGAQQFPLIDQRPELLRTRYAMLLRMAQMKLQKSTQCQSERGDVVARSGKIHSSIVAGLPSTPQVYAWSNWVKISPPMMKSAWPINLTFRKSPRIIFCKPKCCDHKMPGRSSNRG